MNDELLDRLEDMGAEVEDTIDRLMGDEDMYVEYLKKFTTNQNIVKLREAVAKGDAENAMREVHALKGVALNLGLLPLVDACMDMLLDFRADKPQEAMAQMDTVDESYNEWRNAIME